MQASVQGNTQIVDLLLAAGANVHTRDKQGATPLIYANFNSNAIVNRLLAAGAKINVLAKNGLTPLMCSLVEGSHDATVSLLAAGADPNMCQSNTCTPLMFVVLKDNAEQALLFSRILLAAGANPELTMTVDPTDPESVQDPLSDAQIAAGRYPHPARQEVIKILEEAIAVRKTKELEKK
jgi:ankyrin repeat protein